MRFGAAWFENYVFLSCCIVLFKGSCKPAGSLRHPPTQSPRPSLSTNAALDAKQGRGVELLRAFLQKGEGSKTGTSVVGLNRFGAHCAVLIACATWFAKGLRRPASSEYDELIF